MNKRGQFEIQFNWIFVLAVGAIILLLFSVIMLRQKSASEQTTNIFISKNIEAILAGAEVSTGTVNFVDLPKVELNFECNGYRVGSGRRVEIGVMNIFTPSQIKHNRMITWTLDWNLPYRVTNFVYLTSPAIKYILVGDDDLAVSINKNMPEELNKELVEDDNIGNKGGVKARFVYFNKEVSGVPPDFIRMGDKEVTALKITGDKNTGSIEFFEKDGGSFVSKGTSYYLETPSLIGAIFADDIEIYNCVMKNAFKKLNIVTSIYQRKTENLQNYYTSLGDSCANSHEVNNIAVILTASEEFNYGNIMDINEASKALEQQNKKAQLYSCALIY